MGDMVKCCVQHACPPTTQVLYKKSLMTAKKQLYGTPSEAAT
jgi:hypothetical protein